MWLPKPLRRRIRARFAATEQSARTGLVDHAAVDKAIAEMLAARVAAPGGREIEPAPPPQAGDPAPRRFGRKPL